MKTVAALIACVTLFPLEGTVSATQQVEQVMAGHCAATAKQFGVAHEYGASFEGTGPTPPVAQTGQPPRVCRITGSLSPVEGSTIGYEVWMPAPGWNGKLQVLGNGGYSSSINYFLVQMYVSKGYAVAATDTGHKGDDPAFAKGKPETITDWGHRAVHVTAARAKEIVSALYGRSIDYSYFAGCSTGGHQGLMEAQRYPDDFDGILVGAPGHNRTHLNVGFLWQFVQNHNTEGEGPIIPASKLRAISQNVMKHCRGQNGGAAGGLASDPFLNDPFQCDFQPEDMACEGADSPDCLTSLQVTALEAMYDGARDPVTGERIYFGFLRGSEAAGGPSELPGWSLYWADPKDQSKPARASFWQVWASGNPDWRWQDFDFHEDVRAADDRLAGTINAMSPALGAFRNAGGKLLHYHGLADPVVPASDSASYYTRVQETMGDTADFYRFFPVPGMHHCYFGPGPYDLNAQEALEAWVEQGEAPDYLIGRNPGSDNVAAYSRKICRYAEKAEAGEAGEPASWESFTCQPAWLPTIQEVGSSYLR
jgi:feruloyl esterase